MNEKKIDKYRMITNTVCEIYSKTPNEIKSQTRLREFVFPRQVCMTLCMINMGANPKEIGRHYGGFDRNTVWHSVSVVKNLLETDKYIREEIGHLFEGAEWPQRKT